MMRQSSEVDIVCIGKILKYITAIREAYAMFNINSADDLADNYICRLAITQAITNIYELKKKMQADTLAKLSLFDGIGLKAARNIASHDYDSLDFNIIYKRTLQLLRQEVSDELEAIMDAIR